MKKFKLLLVFLFCLSIRSFAHGEQALALPHESFRVVR